MNKKEKEEINKVNYFFVSVFTILMVGFLFYIIVPYLWHITQFLLTGKFDNDK
jgi:hypothetical protein